MSHAFNLEVEERTTYNPPTLRKSQYAYLKRIGLSLGAIQLYGLLLEKGSLSARAAAEYTCDFPSAEYRLLYLLEEKGLVRRLGERPIVFEALPLQDGLQASFVDTAYELKQLLKGNNIFASNRTEQIRIIVGRQAVYDQYVKLARQAKNEICIFAIGIAYTDLIAKTQRDAIKRGVRIRHIVQQRKTSNYYVIDKWLRLGVKLRHLPGPRGYHVSIIDDTHALLTFSDPDDTENRVTILTTNSAVVAIFIAQFDNIWAKANDIKI